MNDPAAILPRLCEVPADAVLAERPPLPDMPPPFGLRPVDPDSGDPELIAGWMALPHLVAAWEQDWGPDRWRADARARLDGTYSMPAIIRYEDRDVGYLEVYRPMRDEIGVLYGASPHDLGYHIAIGRPELTGRGIFGRFMAELGPAMLRSDPECEKLAVEPDYRNTVVHKILRGAGWRDEGEFDARPDRRIRLFTYERGTGR